MLAIIGGVGLLGIVICGGVVGVLAYLGSQHSGWEETTFHGYTVKMPPGSRMQEKTTNLPGATIHEHGHQRRETGSQYFLMVSEPLEAQLQRLEVKQILDRSTVLIGNHQEVVRGGVTGIKGTILDGELADAEAEYFFHNGRLIVTAYAPYSKFKQRVGGKRSPRINETELDKPEEFFESLQLP